jgi:8-oxo-dGTP diphosphatase
VSLPIVHVAAAALIDADGRVLVAQRPADKPMGGMWEFPGGKLEPGETPEDALRRELREELGIEVCCVAPAGFASHAYETFHLILMLFITREWDGSPHGAPIRWLRPHELYALTMPPADLPLLPQLEAMLG